MGKLDGGEKSGKRWIIRIELTVLLAFVCVAVSRELKSRTADSTLQNAETGYKWESDTGEAIEVSATDNYIKWVEFHGTCEALAAAYDLDVATYQDKVHLDWIELLAYTGAKHGGKFDTGSVKEINEAA